MPFDCERHRSGRSETHRSGARLDTPCCRCVAKLNGRNGEAELTANKPLIYLEFLERAKGFEPSTPTLARLCSTPELHPRSVAPWRRARRVICPKTGPLARGMPLPSRRIPSRRVLEGFILHR